MWKFFILLQLGCVPIATVRGSIVGAANEQADIIAGIDGLDDACQKAQSTREGLEACRTPRDKARAALRRQLQHLQGVAR
jgi:hypothetical protein